MRRTIATGAAIFVAGTQAQRGMTRRGFMKNGALALIGTSAIPAFLSRSVLAEMTTAAANKKKLVVLFQRGAVDGLNMVVPYQEKNYYAMRPSIAIQQNEVMDLDGFFGLHPRWRRSSRCMTRGIWRLFMRRDRRIRRGRTLTRRITWRAGRRA